MREIILFCEDSFHEKFVGELVRRFGADYEVDINIRILSAQGGLPKMQNEFKRFLADFNKQSERTPDAVIVVVDANCKGHTSRKKEMDSQLRDYPELQNCVSYAIPDPHIERWMLVDSQAFKTVFGTGCTLPRIKCAKDEYKGLLRKAIRDAGIEPPLGGLEYAEDIVNQMDLVRVETEEPSLRLFLKELKAKFNSWKAEAARR